MENYSKKQTKKQDTLLKLSFAHDSEILNDLIHLPAPIKHDYIKNRLMLTWAIVGFFSTKKNIEYLNDIIARFKLSYDDSKLEKRQTIARTNEIRALELKAFSNNKYLKSKSGKKPNEIVRHDSNTDRVFMCLKVYAEVLCQEHKFFSYDELFDYASDNFIADCKDFSTLKAKCRNIWNWYSDRDFEPTQYIKKNKELVMATRAEQAKKMTKIKIDNSRKKVLNAITGVFANECYKKKNGSWNVTKIAEATNMHRDTVSKYLREFNTIDKIESPRG